MLTVMQMRQLAKPVATIAAILAVIGLWWFNGTDTRIELTDEALDVASVEQPNSDPEIQPAPAEAVSDDAVETSDILDTVTIEGLVRDQQALGISGLQVEVSPKGVVAGSRPVYAATTDLMGRFQVEAVPLGKAYRLEVLAAAGYAGRLLDPLPVSSDMAPLSITLESVELASVEGMFVDSDLNPVAGFEMMVQNMDMAYPGRLIKSDSSGFFSLGQFPTGSLQLTASGKESFRITGIELTAGEYRNLEIMVDKGNYHLSGWVINEFDEPLAQARVLMTSDVAHQGYRSTSYRLVLTDSNGNFGFANIAGVEHNLLIDAVGYQSQSLTHRFQMLSDNLTIRMPRH